MASKNSARIALETSCSFRNGYERTGPNLRDKRRHVAGQEHTKVVREEEVLTTELGAKRDRPLNVII